MKWVIAIIGIFVIIALLCGRGKCDVCGIDIKKNITHGRLTGKNKNCVQNLITKWNAK
jgi:hypothetical protein